MALKWQKTGSEEVVRLNGVAQGARSDWTRGECMLGSDDCNNDNKDTRKKKKQLLKTIQAHGFI